MAIKLVDVQWKCQWCGWKSRDEALLLKHEYLKCRKNPKVKACPTCKHNKEDTQQFFEGGSAGLSLCPHKQFHHVSETKCPHWED
jgi:hypothetical protein